MGTGTCPLSDETIRFMREHLKKYPIERRYDKFENCYDGMPDTQASSRMFKELLEKYGKLEPSDAKSEKSK